MKQISKVEAPYSPETPAFEDAGEYEGVVVATNERGRHSGIAVCIWPKGNPEARVTRVFTSAAESTIYRASVAALCRAVEMVPPGSMLTVEHNDKGIRDGILLDLPRWKKNGWKNAQRKLIGAYEYWQWYDNLCVGGNRTAEVIPPRDDTTDLRDELVALLKVKVAEAA